jgi:hypothetical protein
MKDIPLKPSLPQLTGPVATSAVLPNLPSTGPSALWQGRQVTDAYAIGQAQTTEGTLGQAGALADSSLAKGIQQKMRQQAASGAQNPPSYVWEQKAQAVLNAPKGLGSRLSLRHMQKSGPMQKPSKGTKTSKGQAGSKGQKAPKRLAIRTHAADGASAG